MRRLKLDDNHHELIINDDDPDNLTIISILRDGEVCEPLVPLFTGSRLMEAMVQRLANLEDMYKEEHSCMVGMWKAEQKRVDELSSDLAGAKAHISELTQRYLAEEIYASMITNEQWQSETGDVHENTLRRLASDAIQAVRVFNEVADGQSVNANKTSPREEGCDDESE